MPGPFGQPSGAPPIDLGADIGMGYQQNAANKIAQARVKERKSYTAGYAKKYGVGNVSATVKGKTDTDLYEMAAKLVQKRRGPAAAPVAPKPAAPKVGAKTPKRAPARRRRRAVNRSVPRRAIARRPRRRTSAATTRAATPISAIKIAQISRLV